MSGITVKFVGGEEVVFRDYRDPTFGALITEGHENAGNKSRWHTIEYVAPQPATIDGFLGGAAASAPSFGVMIKILLWYFNRYGYPHSSVVLLTSVDRVLFAKREE